MDMKLRDLFSSQNPKCANQHPWWYAPRQLLMQKWSTCVYMSFILGAGVEVLTGWSLWGDARAAASWPQPAPMAPPQGMAGPCSQGLLVCREGICTADIAATINIMQTVAGPLQRTELQSSNSVWKCVFLLLLVLLFFFYLSDVYRMTMFTRFFYTFSILITQW